MVGYINDDGQYVFVDTQSKQRAIDHRDNATKKEKIMQTPEQLEAAGLRALAEAQALRDFDALEPTGDEPTISWRYNFDPEGPSYTFVAFKADNNYWYVTGNRGHGGGYTWRELGCRPEARNLRDGHFWTVSKWVAVGDP